MILRRFVMVAALTLGFALNAGVASAAYDVDLGTLSVGDSGTIEGEHFGNAILSKITGSLPADSMITFTYNFAGNLVSGFLASAAEYSYEDGGSDYAGYSVSIDPVGFSATSGTVDGSPSTALAVASAQIDFGADTATAVIKNFSSGVLDYVNLFAGLAIGSKDLQIAYSVSAVPLPAALPLFGVGLGALAGFGARRRKKAREEALAA